MLVSVSRRLAYLAMPKTGTQSLERALAPLCDIRYGGLPRVKHMTLQTFERFVRPYLEALGAGDTETLCVIREPVDWLGSWYRYRGRAALDGHPNSTKDLSFAEFVEAYLNKPTPPFARVGRISRFVRPYLEALGAGDTETLCVIREPVDWLGSWYRYRGRAALDGHPNSTKDLSFAEFVEAYLNKPTPPFARVGRISRFVAGASGGPGVTHMFRYENLAGVTRFLSDRFETAIVLPRVNVSSRARLDLPAALRARLETELSEDFALYADHAR